MLSYGSVCNLGHKSILNIFDGEVFIEEKVDGSLFCFGVFEGQLCCRSKGAEIYTDSEGKCLTKMFQKAVDTASLLYADGLLTPGWTYYYEYLQKPKHNTLCYGRVPKNNLILFDVDQGDQNFLSPQLKQEEAQKINLECVPLLYEGNVKDFTELKAFLNRISILGGTKIEGMVIKNYNLYTADKKYMKGKYVSEAFKETHQKNWKVDGTKKEIVQEIIMGLRTEARWDKAIQHLKERDELTDSLKDIGPLLKEVQVDIEKEEEEAIKDALYKHFKKNILRGAIGGFPEYYKEKLAKQSFEEENV